MKVVNKQHIPHGHDVMYANFICDYWLHKAEKHRVQLCVGGYYLAYSESSSPPVASLMTVKLLLNSAISTKGIKFAMCNIRDFYSNTPMEKYENMCIHHHHVPTKIQI